MINRKREVLEAIRERISRIEVIDEGGRVFVKMNLELSCISIQDEGRTMKLFIKNRGNNNEI